MRIYPLLRTDTDESIVKVSAMHKRSLILAALVLLLVTAPRFSLAESGIVGSWSGSISAGEYSFGASVTFTEGGSYSIRAGGLTSSGSYSASGSSITLNPSSPPGFSATTMSLSLSDGGNRAVITGTINGLRGTLSLRRRVVTPVKNPVFARWQLETQDSLITLELYESGWLYWHESYEKSANTRLLARIREGIQGGTLTDTAQILSLMDSAPLFAEFGGKLTPGREGFAVSPPGGAQAGAPALWALAWNGAEGAWVFRASVQDGVLVLGAGGQELAFRRLGDTAGLPGQPYFRAVIPLKAGDRGPLVSLLQTRLAEMGMFAGPADGEYSDATRDAVRSFEQAHSLPEDGEADEAVLRLLYADAPNQETRE